jgi:hypothetical protein
MAVGAYVMIGYDDGSPDDELPEEIGPDDPDYDLSEAHGYRWEPTRENWPVPPWLLVLVTLIVLAGLLLPGIIFIAQRG